MVKVKICGITDTVDAVFAAANGANAIGCVFEPTSPRFLGDLEELESIQEALNHQVTLVAVYGVIKRPIPDGFDVVQGQPANGDNEPIPPLIQTFRMGGRAFVPDPRAIAYHLDAFSASEYGGTGQTVDWDLAAEFVNQSPLPVILSGGLTPDNVGIAIETVRPQGVDVSSGVEKSPGRKDPAKVRDFILAAHQAFNEVESKK